MKVRPPFSLPEDKEAQLSQARRLEWLTILFMISIIILMGLTLGSSQAMKAAWVEDFLSLVPPAAFLVATRFCSRPPDGQFPYGYRRAITIAFLCASVALLTFGIYILFDSVLKLIAQERPTIGSVELFGRQVWLGWLMIAVLVYSIIPPVVLGHLKLPLATELHEKVLHADADMNKADWMTGLAAILGIVGIGLGYWWADSVAAGLISLDIVKDGSKNLKHAVMDLMDERPTTVEREEEDPNAARIKAKLQELDWVSQVAVRLREEGDVLTGEAYIVPVDERNLLNNLNQAAELTRSLDWRIYDVSMVPVSSLGDKEHEEKEVRG